MTGIGLKTGYTFSSTAAGGRSGDDWEAELSVKKNKQGFNPSAVVKDGDKGLADSTSRVFPEAEQREDIFHAEHRMGNLLKFWKEEP